MYAQGIRSGIHTRDRTGRSSSRTSSTDTEFVDLSLLIFTLFVQAIGVRTAYERTAGGEGVRRQELRDVQVDREARVTTVIYLRAFGRISIGDLFFSRHGKRLDADNPIVRSRGGFHPLESLELL